MMSKQPVNMSIGAMAAAAGVKIETVRFYQRKGLLPTPKRLDGEIRRYGADEVARVKFVKAAQRLGFSLVEVGALLKLDDGTHCKEAREMAEEKLTDVRAKLRDLRRIESALETVIADCSGARGAVTCPLIASLRSN
jgi:MerR family mercuric resistance operon transcriptional regulator